jgi:UDP-4-amino-4,6-dideoxy-N-acetyl-beta-L-altrosamine transaminase
MIPYGRQDITESDIEAVVGVLRSDFLTQGPCVPQFEKRVVEYCGAAHGVAVNSATSALHIACLALGVGPGDVVWTSPITFVASANCARYCGADVGFVDIDPDTYNMSVTALAGKLEEAARQGRLPKVVIPVHMCGQSCDMAGIQTLSRHYGFRVIEDASHAIGGRYDGRPVGDCRFSDITVFSFHPVKIITTAEGGLATTNQPELAHRMALLRSHGITRDSADMEGDSQGPWYYQQVDLGFNYRMTELQAALGVSQMDRLDGYVARRHVLAERYDRLLADYPVILPVRDEKTYSAFHLYVIRLTDEAKPARHETFTSLRTQGVGVNVHYIPVHTHPYYRRLGFKAGDFPVAEAYYERAISLPLFPGLDEAAQYAVVTALGKALSS